MRFDLTSPPVSMFRPKAVVHAFLKRMAGLCLVSLMATTLCAQQEIAVTIHLSESGTLVQKISAQRLKCVSELKITGSLDGDDVNYLRSNLSEQSGKGLTLDLSDAKFVGRQWYDYGSRHILLTKSSIGERMFSGLQGLGGIVLPRSVRTIEPYAFADCKRLAFVRFPDELRTIGEGAFSGCTLLDSISLPDSLTAVGEKAFARSWLTDVFVKNSTPPSAAQSSFVTENLNAATLHVPAGTHTQYWLATGWSTFPSIVEEKARKQSLSHRSTERRRRANAFANKQDRDDD